MKPAAKLTPIPTPLAHRVRRAKMSLLPALVCVGSLMVVTILWQDRVAVSTMAAPAEGVSVMQSPMALAGVELALPLNISLPPGLNIRPGGLVDLSIIPRPE